MSSLEMNAKRLALICCSSVVMGKVKVWVNLIECRNYIGSIDGPLVRNGHKRNCLCVLIVSVQLCLFVGTRDIPWVCALVKLFKKQTNKNTY